MIWILRNFYGGIVAVYNNEAAAQLHKGNYEHSYVTAHPLCDNYVPPTETEWRGGGVKPVREP